MEFNAEWLGLIVFGAIVLSRLIAAARGRGRSSKKPAQEPPRQPPPVSRLPEVESSAGEPTPRPIEPR